MRKRDTPLNDEQERPGEPFLQRFHRRKLEARGLNVAPDESSALTNDAAAPSDAAAARPVPELTDDDMPPLESLDEDSDYAGFLSAKVSESLRRAALRKLFHSSTFNVIDELDDYAEDFTTFEALGDLITADMRHRLDVEAKRQAELLRVDEAKPPATTDDSNDTGESLQADLAAPDADAESEPTADTADAGSSGTPTTPTAETETHAERPADT